MSESVAVVARKDYSPEQVDLIRNTVARDCNPAELALFLEVVKRHELDPFVKEVWAIRMVSSGPVQTVVAKDGLLKIANRCTGPGWAGQSGEFLGCTSGAVHQHDIYDVERRMRDDGTLAVVVTHQPRTEDGKATFGGMDMSARGDLVGAWAVCRRRGHDDIFFEASRKEYDKRKNAWQTHPHAMMVKVAEAMVLRKAFPISGVVGEGELDRVSNATHVQAEGSDEIRWPENEELARDLRDGFTALGYRRAKVRALVNACASEEDFLSLLSRLQAEADEIPEAEVVEQ